MAEIKLTKNELRMQETRLKQLKRYLPTLQLKKAMLQSEVAEAKIEIEKLENAYTQSRAQVEGFSPLFTAHTSVNLQSDVQVSQVKKDYENIAGVEIPIFQGVDFHPLSYSLFDTPPWVDAAVVKIKEMVISRVKVTIAEEKKAALEKELREVSIRVNLFEKILIPRAVANIKKIKVFLGDQQLAAVSQAKVAKGKIIKKKAKVVPPDDVIPKEVLSHAN
ncbi:V-type ATP synthase subunit D [Chlamydiales bacterium SCGC AG-110-M15]|nr:V-type ATP synthase subunit D [Chlamydiales bacterium SCGC AG-110-M15]